MHKFISLLIPMDNISSFLVEQLKFTNYFGNKKKPTNSEGITGISIPFDVL